MDDKSVSCQECEEKELDVLIAVYAYIHLSEDDFISVNELLEEIDPVNGVGLNRKFLSSWIRKEWLEKNDVDCVRVPEPIQESLDQDGFELKSTVRETLKRIHEGKPAYDPEILKDFKSKVEKDDEKRKRQGMVYIERLKTKRKT